ncbi:carbamoylphosphate synthase large subunit [Streptococcus pneumoniae]|nr:carbamoylphosphate synthase large subunit [Streptococcus pneumoniae]CVO45074.1 carbamoylphosphate synthase large subunit [Streptococcus pneumoniae]CVQ96670.1 carbamoylphosphate synthase large subunit [Streptococcus pneumoniae]CVW63581.1 carbamoylphosphate synthase large subunit [Streptococcus pneumoniae]CWE05217.1 carbamoylphosphate synthase large subunit [Streptococcus pneumoniae]
MNYLVISPYYPQNFQQFTIELANKGITGLGNWSRVLRAIG